VEGIFDAGYHIFGLIERPLERNGRMIVTHSNGGMQEQSMNHKCYPSQS
jgi:hypothetical protein